MNDPLFAQMLLVSIACTMAVGLVSYVAVRCIARAIDAFVELCYG